MAATLKVYSYFANNAVGGSGTPDINWLDDNIYCALVTDSYTPSQSTHDFYDDVVGYEITGTGYDTNGVLIAGKTLVTSGLVTTFDCNNPEWPGSTFTARYGIFYDRTPGSDATRPLICYVDFGGNQNPSDSTFVISVNASGLFTVTVS